jgi:3-dehydroquinate dehydratase/shikimate dehydrogenase
MKPLNKASSNGRPGRCAERRSNADLVACLTTFPSFDRLNVSHALWQAGWLLVRSDLIGHLSTVWLRTIHPWRLIYSLRTRAHGGHADLSDPARLAELGKAARTYDLVELEAPHDLSCELLAAVPPGRRLVTWRVPPESKAALARRLEWLTQSEAAVYQLIVDGRSRTDGIAPLETLLAAERDDTVAYATGEASLWSRVLSPLLGSPLVFGNLEETPLGDEPSVSRLVDDFGLPNPGPVRMTYGIAGDPVSHSLSPRLHNACYRAAGVPALYLPFTVDSFGPFWAEFISDGVLERLGLPLCGLTVASPNKEMALAAASAVSPRARRAWSTNLLYRRQGHWVADTTDPEGVLEMLAVKGIAIAGRRAAVIGCGGSGRAIAAALVRAGSSVVLANRSHLRGEMASRRLGLPLLDYKDLRAQDFNLIVNATPVGRSSAELPFACDRLEAGTVIIDLVYSRQPTPLAIAAAARGAQVINGHEILLVQARRQFERMTGKLIPMEIMSNELHQGRAAPASDEDARRRSIAINPVGTSHGLLAVE